MRRRTMMVALVAAAIPLAGKPRAARARLLLGADGGSARGTTAKAARRTVRRAGQELPEFTDVAQVGPEEALLFLAGKHPRYPGASLDSLIGFSPADILETCDTDVLDNVLARRGVDSIVTVYRVIAHAILETVLDVYGGAPVVLALDAGHGGKKGVYFDPGSQGTEWEHARRVVGYVEEAQAGDPRFAAIVTRRIFNDEIGDDFGLPPPEDRKSAASLTLRNVRASMLAYEAAQWNAQVNAEPGTRNPEQDGDGNAQQESQAPEAVAVHVISVHFNAGSGGTLVLHEGDTVPAAYRDLSVAYARAYVDRVRPALNETGLLPYALRLALGTGLSDDRLLYEPPMRLPSRVNPYTGVDRASFPRRYAMLQTSLLERDYADGALRYRAMKAP